jgi:Cu-Zn family superoxide dismutase
MKRLAICLAAIAFSAPAIAQDSAATANMMDMEGTSLGVLELTTMDGHVHITGELTGLTASERGIHIHETGDCDAATKFESAGGHFNPTDHQHGTENPEGPHAGDIPNLVTTADGGTPVDITAEGMTLGEGENSLFDADGSSIVIHADADDYRTDPAGNSGERIVCGVIEAAPAQ